MSKKIVLAYSGGLDTSVIAKWLQENYEAEVIAFTANIGQDDDLSQVEEKAKKIGISKVYIEDLTHEFVKNYVFPMMRANPLYESVYFLGTSIARPLIGKRLAQIAKENDAYAISHGATGKGNDQIRFELAVLALNPKLEVIAPWRIWDLNSRTDLVNYCQQHNIPIEFYAGGTKSPYSMDANIMHISYEGGELENPWNSPNSQMWRWTKNLEDTPNTAEEITIEFKAGDAIKINSQEYNPRDTLVKLNELGAKHGIGRIDIVESRYIGMKSRGCYETPGATILMNAHRAIESICLDREEIALKEGLMPKYAQLVYNGYWFSPEREAIQKLIDHSQQAVEGEVKLSLFKGNIIIQGRRSQTSLFDEQIVSFEDDQNAYNQKDAEGFIRLNALRLKKYYSR